MSVRHHYHCNDQLLVFIFDDQSLESLLSEPNRLEAVNSDRRWHLLAKPREDLKCFQTNPILCPARKRPRLVGGNRPMPSPRALRLRLLVPPHRQGNRTLLTDPVSRRVNAVFSPVGFLVDHHANMFLQAKVLVPVPEVSKTLAIERQIR